MTVKHCKSTLKINQCFVDGCNCTDNLRPIKDITQQLLVCPKHKPFVKAIFDEIKKVETYTFAELIRSNLEYTRFGKKYKKLKRWEIIKEGAMQSWCNGELQPIKNYDNDTVGDIPASFSDERDFYNLI